LVITWDIGRKKGVSRLDAGSMQIGRYTLSHRTGRSRLFPQYRCCSQLTLAGEPIEHRRQYRQALRDKREYPGKANCCYEKKMCTEPSRVNALTSHLLKHRTFNIERPTPNPLHSGT